MKKLIFKKQSGLGFTLIELLVVIAIIGVLASIVLASLNSARRKSRDARRITDIKQLQLALELFFDTTDAGGAGTGNQYPTAISSLASTYIPVEPKDPSTNASYLYAYPGGTRTTYHIGAVLEDPANSAFNSDKDCNSSVGGGTCPTGYTYGFTGGFDGTTDATNRHYDIMP